MAKIKIDQFNDYYNAELIGAFPDEVCILGGGDTEEEAIAEMKANAEVWLEYVIEEANVEQSCNGYRVECKSEDKKRRRRMNLERLLSSSRMVADDIDTKNETGDKGLMNTQTEIDKAYKEGYEKGAEEMRLEAKKPIEKFIKQRERRQSKSFRKS